MASTRMYTVVIMIVTIVLLFHFSGILSDSPSGTGYVLGTLGLTNPQNFGTTDFWTTILGLGALTVAGIAIGAYLTRSFEGSLFFAIGVNLLLIMIGISWDLILIYNELNKMNNMLAVMLTSPILIGMGIIIYDWVRGRD